jgi:hypothetical protein
LRLRAEDPQTVASECGTSLQMLSTHYAYAIEDLRESDRDRPTSSGEPHGPHRQTIVSHEQAQRAADHEDAQSRRKFFAWFSARKRGSHVS